MQSIFQSSPQRHVEQAERVAGVPSANHPPASERFTGFAILGQRFASGHVFAVRRWYASSLGPAYTSVWHQYPDGAWRLYANASDTQSFTPTPASGRRDDRTPSVRVRWVSPYRLCVNVPEVRLEWEIDFRRTWMTRAFSVIRFALPDMLISSAPVQGVLEWIARNWLDIGTLELSGIMPNGTPYRVLPRHVWLMQDSRAWLRGASLGVPDRSSDLARIGGLSVPTSGALAFVSARATTVPPAFHR